MSSLSRGWQAARQTFRQARPTRGSGRLRTKIVSTVVVVVAMLAASVVVVTRARLEAGLQARLDDVNAAVARDLAVPGADLLLTGDMFGLQQLVRRVVKNYPDIRYAVVIDREGTVVAHTFNTGLPQGFLAVNRLEDGGDHRFRTIRTEEGLIRDIVVALGGGAGNVRLGVSYQELVVLLGQLTTDIALLALAILVGSVLAAVLLSDRIVRPIDAVRRAAQAVAEGDLSVEVNEKTQNETGELGRAFNAMTQELRRQRDRNRFIEGVFGRYASDAVVRQLLDDPEGLALGGEERVVTLLMCDLRGFSALATSLPVKRTVMVLNRYLERMTDVVLQHGGVIHDFIGDSIFAVFGAPIASTDHARRGVTCALSMQLELEQLSRTMEAEGFPALHMGVGVHTGSAIAGNVGSVKHAKYGVVGPVVNLTSRLEDCALAGQVLITEAVLKELGAQARVGPRLFFEVKGFEEPIQAYELVGLMGTPDIAQIAREQRPRELREKYPIHYRRVAADRVGDVSFRGEVRRLSDGGAEIELLGADACPLRRRDSADGERSFVHCPVLPAVGDQMEISMSSTTNRILATAVYGRVMECSKVGETPRFNLRFTSMSPAARMIIDGLLKSSLEPIPEAATP